MSRAGGIPSSGRFSARVGTATARVLWGAAMFTGLVQATGRLLSRSRRGPGYRLRVAAALKDCELGESVAVNGSCLTVVAFDESGFELDVSVETAERTTVGRLAMGTLLNLERALRLGDRLGGHLVGGHVDAVGRVVSLQPQGESLAVTVEATETLRGLLAPKGSVAIDGVSLTINASSGSRFEVMLIPHTQSHTNLQSLKVGLEVNLEADILARYVTHWLSEHGTAGQPSSRRDESLLGALGRAGML
jgi:riboflavin synthase